MGVSPSHNRSLSFSSHASPRSPDTSIDTSCLPDSFSPGAYDSSLRSSSSVAMSPSESSDLLHPTIRTRPLSELYLDSSMVDSRHVVASKSFVAAAKEKPPQHVSVLPSEPQTFSQALKSDFKAEWEKAMLEEIN